MPTYSIQAPDGKTYQVDGPAGASQEDVQAEVMRQNPGAGGSAPAPAAAAPSLRSRLTAPATGFNNAVATTLGFPVDAVTPWENLIRKGVGAQQLDPSAQMFGGDWWRHAFDRWGMQTHVDNPEDPVQRYGAAAGLVGPSLAAGPVAGMRALAGSFGAQYLSDQGAPVWAQAAAGIAGGKTGLSNLTKAGAKLALQKLESTAPAAVQTNLADAQSVNPDGQTVAQSTGRPMLATLGQGAAGATTQAASAAIVDKLSAGMTDQAKRIAPLGVSNPEVASQVQKAIEAKDAELAQRGDAVYTSGRAAVAKDPTQVGTFNTVNALDQMMAEVNDPKVLAPPVVTERLQKMIDTLRGKSAVSAPPGSGLATAPPIPPGTNWAGFYDLRKQINTLYDTFPKDQITPALDQTFSRLKAAYYQDLEAAPAGPAKTTTVKANQIYQGIADQRDNLKNSVVASVLGKQGKSALSDPDAVLDRLVTLRPSAQNYVRNILETYSPNTLDSLRSYAITKNVQDAARTGAPATISATNARALTPGKLADSGLFTTEQAAELNARESALRTALTALPEKGAATAEVTAQSAGRLVGGGFNPVFLGGTLANTLTAGKLERVLNTPEGRNSILNPATSRSKDVQSAVRAYQAALLAQVAQERQAATAPPPQQGQQQQPTY